MTEQQVFSFDEKVYKRNKNRRFLRNFGIASFFFLLTHFAFILFYDWGGDASFLLGQYWRSIGYFVLAVLLGGILSYFFGPDPTPRQTIRINGDEIEIVQGDKIFKIEKRAVTAIAEYTDSLNIKVGKTTYQLTKDVNNTEDLISILNHWTPISNRSLRPLLIIVATLLGTMLFCFTSYYFLLQFSYWPLLLFVILFAGFSAYMVYRDWKNPPFENSDRQSTNKQFITGFIVVGLVILLTLFLALFFLIS